MMKIICCILLFIIGIYIGKMFGELCKSYSCKGYSTRESLSIACDKSTAYYGVLPVSELYKEVVSAICDYEIKCIDETLSSCPLKVNDSKD